MRLKILCFGVLALLLTACDKCGDAVHFNAPSLPKTCTGDTPAEK